MRYSSQAKERAIHLWKEGYTLSQIAARLSVPKTTIHYWVRAIIVKSEIPAARQFERIEKMRAQQRAATAANVAKCAARRQQAYEAAIEKAQQLLADQHIRDFVVLYLAEGFRKDRNVVAISNSNPRIIEFSYNCMRELATNLHFYLSFQYHADQDPEALKLFWSSLLQIRPEQIKPVPKTNSGHLKHRRFACEYGIFQVKVCDTRFRAELQALMDVLQEQWASPAPRL